MSLRLVTLLFFGVLVQSISAVDNLPSDELPQDFFIALKSARKVYESMIEGWRKRKDVGVVDEIWNSIVRTMTDKQGSKSIADIFEQARNAMQDHNAHKTIVHIAAMLHNGFTHQELNPNLKFPWPEFRKLLYSKGLPALPKLYTGIWNIALNAETADKFSKVVEEFGRMFGEMEERKGLNKYLGNGEEDNLRESVEKIMSEKELGTREIQDEDYSDEDEEEGLEERDVFDKKRKRSDRMDDDEENHREYMF